MAEIHTFRIAGGAGGVEGGGDGVLVEIGSRARAGRGQQRLVFADQAGQFRALLHAVGEQDGPLHRGQLPRHRLVERDELAVHQHEAILGVVHGVEDLLRGEADIDGMQHRPDHRDGEHAFQVAMAVPVHHRHRVAGLHPGLAEYVGQARDALVEGGVAVAHLVAVDDFMTLFVTTAGKHQALDQQRILISAGGAGMRRVFSMGRTPGSGFVVRMRPTLEPSAGFVHQSKSDLPRDLSEPPGHKIESAH